MSPLNHLDYPHQVATSPRLFFVQWVLLLLFAIQFFMVNAAQATVIIRYPLDRLIHDAGPICVGTVTGHATEWGDESHRWMRTRYTMHIQKNLDPSYEINNTSEITVSFWGGTIGTETQKIAGMVLPETGKQYIVLLRKDWSTDGFTPVVGFEQGLFNVSSSGIVTEIQNQPLVLTNTGCVSRGGDVAPEKVTRNPVTLAVFEAYLRAHRQRIKTLQFVEPGQAERNDPRVLPTYAKQPQLDNAVVQRIGNSVAPHNSILPSVAAPRLPELANMSAARASVLSTRALWPTKSMLETLPQRISATKPTYFSQYAAHLPIVVNSFPSSFGVWTPEDQYQMSKWNYYGGEFRVLTSPTGMFGWPDNSWDLAGWPDSATLQRVYGSGWSTGTLGVTFFRFDGSNYLLEADIAMNPSYSWTLDDDWVWNGSSAISFRQTLLHELGHMWGLDHQFEYLSIMNYEQMHYRAYAIPFTDDAEAIRARYPDHAVGHTDLGVYLFYSSGHQSWSDATYPSAVFPGRRLTVSNFSMENVGTVTIDSPTVEWYLSETMDYGAGSYYFLGTTSYSALPPFTQFLPAAMVADLTVPEDVPIGTYYLGGFIRNDDGSINSVPLDNNHAWSSNMISVVPPKAEIAAVTPSSGSTYGGSLLTIDGVCFNDITGTVKIGGLDPASILSWTDTEIICVTKPHSAGTVDVTVKTNTNDTATSVNAYTYVTPTLTITAPNGTERWARGTTQAITWTSQYLDPAALVTLDLYKAGIRVQTIKTVANTGAFSWAIPATQLEDTKYTIRISYQRENDTSNGTFTIFAPPAVSAISPTTGPPAGGQQVTISGSFFGLKKGTGSVTFDDLPATVYQSWTASRIVCTTPAHLPGAVNVKVTTLSGDRTEVSNGYTFSDPVLTVTAPNGGERWGRNLSQLITWTSLGEVGNTVKIELLRGATHTLIAGSATNSGSYRWTPSTTLTLANDYLIRVSSLTKTGISDTSNNPFTLVVLPSISVVTPTKGIVLGGKVVTISGAGFGTIRGTIDFGGVPVTSISSWKDTSISCLSPPHTSGTVTVTVTNNAGDSALKVNAYTYTLN